MQAENAVATAVLEMVDAVNRGDFDTAVAAFTEAPVIVEDIAPYVWQGAGAPSDWLRAMGANAARLNVQSVLLALDQPTRVEVNAEEAYALIPGAELGDGEERSSRARHADAHTSARGWPVARQQFDLERAATGTPLNVRNGSRAVRPQSSIAIRLISDSDGWKADSTPRRYSRRFSLLISPCRR